MSSSSPSSRGSTPPPHNVQPVSTIDDGSGPVSAERFLAIHSNKLSVLFALCIGLEETIDDKTVPLMDLSEDSFKSIKKKKDIKPSLEILREEVKRRSEINNQDRKKPRPNSWNAKRCTDWLKANPITEEADVAFLVKRAKENKQVVANPTQKNSSSDVTEQGNKWFGPLPYLRLIHCLLEDDIKEKWIHRNDPKSIQEIDARRSDVRDENAFEMIANRWNSSDFNPTTMVSTCHHDFSEEIDVGFDATSEFARASPDKVKDRLSKMKANLSSIIENWERSGQGDEGRIDEDDDDEEEPGGGSQDSSVEGVASAEKYQWGRSEGRQKAFDCRESFLGSNPSYLLYFWDVLDKNDLFDTNMKKRHKEVQESEDNRLKMVQGEATDNRLILQATLDRKGYLKRRIDTLKDEARQIRFKIFESEQAFYKKELKDLEDEIAKCNEEHGKN
ncbi:hypothetical protein IV203_038551 [Nitzschia inconspicua]|uniref:Uncharacterized protein n=1 Tax=Nitzschia inconspicua TaxID=303405 RepID=A0A9K3LN34_9STRA|nr:hypothetical protein IV203_038551 [Nitzschia inconspicua]